MRNLAGVRLELNRVIRKRRLGWDVILPIVAALNVHFRFVVVNPFRIRGVKTARVFARRERMDFMSDDLDDVIAEIALNRGIADRADFLRERGFFEWRDHPAFPEPAEISAVLSVRGIGRDFGRDGVPVFSVVKE